MHRKHVHGGQGGADAGHRDQPDPRAS
jgi:hypothetical protein